MDSDLDADELEALDRAEREYSDWQVWMYMLNVLDCVVGMACGVSIYTNRHDVGFCVWMGDGDMVFALLLSMVGCCCMCV